MLKNMVTPARGGGILHTAEDFSIRPWFYGESNLDRRSIYLLNRIRCGHCGRRAHLASKKFLVDDLCECGTDVHSIDHLIWNCPLIVPFRSKFVLLCRKLNIASGTNTIEPLNTKIPTKA